MVADTVFVMEASAMINWQDIEFAVSTVVGFGIAVTMKRHGCSFGNPDTRQTATVVLIATAMTWQIAVDAIFR